MSKKDSEAVIGSDSVTIESIVITLLSFVVIGFSTDWEYYLVFQLALIAVIFILLFRVMANKASDPDLNIIKNSLRWSSKLLQVVLIGAIATISLHVNSHIGFLVPVAIFAAISCTLSISFALLDQLLLGEYAETWADIISEETEDNLVGAVIRDTAEFGKVLMESVLNDEPASKPEIKGVLLGMVLLSLLLVLSLPISLILAEFFGHWGTAVLVVLSLVFLRDLTRYIYINYGAAQSFSDLRWPLKWEFTWTVVMGVLLAGVLGYDLTTVL